MWCISVFSYDPRHGLLVLIFSEEPAGVSLCVNCVPLSQLDGCTAELIGTNINGNPYGTLTIIWPD